MTDDEIRNFVGKEHFPDCECFRLPGNPVAEVMYGMAQQWATGLIGTALEEGFCPSALPYLLAMATDMAIAELGARALSEKYPGMKHLTPAVSMEYAETQQKLHALIRTRLAALEKRGHDRCLTNVEGSNSVQ